MIEWRDAPPWAKYLGINADRTAFWYENPPLRNGKAGWLNSGGRCEQVIMRPRAEIRPIEVPRNNPCCEVLLL